MFELYPQIEYTLAATQLALTVGIPRCGGRSGYPAGHPINCRLWCRTP